jgi:beta-glucosidase
MHQIFPKFSRHAALAVILVGSAVGCRPAPANSISTGTSGSTAGSTDSSGSGGGGGNGDTGSTGNMGGNSGPVNTSGTSAAGSGGTNASSSQGGKSGGSTTISSGGAGGSTVSVGGAGGSGGIKTSGGTTSAGGAGGSGGASSAPPSTVAKTSCTDQPAAALGYPADQHTKFQTQANATLLNLSLADKAQQMRGTDPGSATSRNWNDIFRQPDGTKIRGYTFRDGPRGVNLDAPIQATSTSHGKSTVFPVSMARGAAWDVDLENRIGQSIGDEMVAANQTMLLAPTVNLLRHPFWGRAQETYGEDPFQLGTLGAAMVKGVQTYVAACAKHYAANNIEDLRASKNASMDEQTLREIYARHFEMIVKDGGVACIMAAYNLVNGTNCTQNAHLLTDILRTDFGFNGFVLSDWWAMPGGNGATPSATEAATAIKAGLDMELPWNLHYSMIESTVGPSLPQATVDASVVRILEQKYRFGADKLGVTGAGLKTTSSTFSGGSIATNNAHIAIAQEAALKSMVLLKNNNNTLPIKSSVTKIAVIGVKEDYWAPVDSTGKTTGPGINNRADDVNNGTIDFANGVRVGDVGSSRVNFDSSQAVGPCAGIKAAAGSGVSVTCSNSASDAAAADFVVVVAGLTPYDEGEEYNGSGDRTSLALDGKDNGRGNAGVQNTLITTVAQSKGTSMVVVLEGGSVIDMPWLDSVPAVVMAWYPGMKGGTALGQLLFGKANFSGKLPISWPKASDLPTFDSGSTTQMDYYVGYRYYDNKGITPVFSFGYGMSYTKFDYSNLVVPCSDATKNSVVNVSVDVTNSGTVAGDEVVLLFVSYPSTTKKRPVKELKGFARVSLDAGAKSTVTIPVRVSDLKFYDTSGWAVESGTVKVMVGPSSANLPLSDTFTVK